ncbi:Ig-like domain-containing protein, partial [Moellerella wisconsensis]|uniref:Ig-like domain-containing protein n=1 Tax=Moellerella wisconsensis TaxID=158849 RepID=UPI003076173C
SVTVVTPPSQGKVVIDPITGKATYTPNPGAHGEDTFTYTVKDKAGNISEPAIVTVHISANPDAQDDGASTQENTPVAIDILNNDSDKDGDLDPTSVTVVTPPSQGKVVIDPISGKATYTPNPGAHGEDTFTYTVKDKAGNISQPATVTVHISANPDAQDDGASTQENTPVAIDVLGNDSDKDGDLDPTSVTIVKSPAQGTVAIDPISGKATYTPNPGAHGEDTFTYTVKDKAGNISEPATVTVHISANPDAQDDGASTQENTPVAIDVLGNDSDKDGDLDPTSVTVVTPPSQGKVVIDPITGKATYTPNPGAHGEDTFTYTVKDKAGNISQPATVTVHISANPDAQDDGASTQENTPVAIDVLGNDSDKDGDLDPTSVTVVTPPSQGKVVIDPITGKATYTPNPGAHGEDTFTYTVKDKAGNISQPATVTVHISANPDAQDDGASTQENTPVAIDILNNDSDKDDDLDPTSVTVVTPPSQGKVVIDPITGKATYTPNPGAHGEDTFTYTVKDKAGNISEPATVTVHISANPDAQDDGASTQENTPVAIDILNNDSDKDGDLDPTSVTVVTPPSQGKVVIDPITGKATYTPNPGAHGEDTFTYTVKDKAGNISEPATVTVHISANPDAQDDGASTQENTPVAIDILNNDSDKDGDLDPTSVTVVKPPSQGKVVIDPITGKATYTPNPGAHGEDTFTYTVKDKAGNIS